MRILYFDCFSGISGDMSLAALVDAGADVTYIETELAKIKIEPFSLSWKRVNKRGISALKMDVILDPNVMPQHHRHYSEIVEAIVSAGFSARATALSLAIFEKIAIAEAKIHDIPIEKVHFHEVGAIDSIVDVIGVALAIDSLAVDRVLSSPVPLGSGTVHCDHGIYPVPAPATLEMMRGLPIAQTAYKLEMTTPTGAGIISGTVDHFSASLPPMIIESIGYGAGTRDLPNQPNVLRVVVGKTEVQAVDWQVQSEQLVVQEHQHHEHHHHPHSEEHGHDHSHEHDHGHSHEHDHGHSHEHKHDHSNEHTHEHSHEDGNEHDHGHTHTPNVERHTHPHKHDETQSDQQAPIKH
jgi:uncharacterized protein (TIGR00299 family) protein